VTTTNSFSSVHLELVCPISPDFWPRDRPITPFGGRIGLLAIAPDAFLVLIELKCDPTPREVAAQGLDYAAILEYLEYRPLGSTYTST
jgi:hypothetical protein